MNVISNALGKIGSWFSGLGTTAVKDYKGATQTISNDVSTVEKDVKVVMWVAIVLFIVYVFGGRR
jgi:hypothetical protein